MARLSSPALAHLRIQHLLLLDALVESGSLHRAARLLRMSQPSASAKLKEVENAFGAALFERNRQGVALTADGRVAIARLRTILGELNALGVELGASPALPVIRIGAVQHAFFGLLPRALPRFLARVECRVELVDGTVAALFEHLQQNDLDCLLGRMPPAWIESFDGKEFFYQTMYEERICVAAPASHRLAALRKPGIKDLAEANWILPKVGSNSRDILSAALASAGLPPPRVRMETSSFAFTLPLLPGSGCLTVGPRAPCADQARLGHIKILPIVLPQVLAPVAFVARHSAMLNPNLQSLWQALRKAQCSPDAGER